MIALEGRIKPPAYRGKNTNLLQTANGHQNAQEEKNGAHVYARDDAHDALLRLTGTFVLGLVTVEKLGGQPQCAQHQQNANERRHVCDTLEDGHENQAAHTQPEHRLALPLGQALMHRSCIGTGHRGYHVALEVTGQNVSGKNHRHDGGDEQFLNNTRRRDEPLVPQHDGSDISDRRKRATGVGRNDDERGIDDAVFMVVYQLAQNHHHDNGRRHIIQDGREEESQNRDAPQQGAFAFGLQQIAHEVETTVLVHRLYNNHRAHQKEQGSGSTAQVSFDDGTGRSGYATGRDTDKIAGIKHIKSPRGDEHQQGHSCLVDLGHSFQGNTQVSENEYNDNSKCDG